VCVCVCVCVFACVHGCVQALQCVNSLRRKQYMPGFFTLLVIEKEGPIGLPRTS
jgi:hypothetical protein